MREVRLNYTSLKRTRAILDDHLHDLRDMKNLMEDRHYNIFNLKLKCNKELTMINGEFFRELDKTMMETNILIESITRALNEYNKSEARINEIINKLKYMKESVPVANINTNFIMPAHIQIKLPEKREESKVSKVTNLKSIYTITDVKKRELELEIGVARYRIYTQTISLLLILLSDWPLAIIAYILGLIDWPINPPEDLFPTEPTEPSEPSDPDGDSGKEPDTEDPKDDNNGQPSGDGNDKDDCDCDCHDKDEQDNNKDGSNNDDNKDIKDKLGKDDSNQNNPTETIKEDSATQSTSEDGSSDSSYSSGGGYSSGGDSYSDGGSTGYSTGEVTTDSTTTNNDTSNVNGTESGNVTEENKTFLSGMNKKTTAQAGSVAAAAAAALFGGNKRKNRLKQEEEERELNQILED